MDQTKARYETFDELYQYCYHVASVVGLIVLPIFGYQDEAARVPGRGVRDRLSTHQHFAGREGGRRNSAVFTFRVKIWSNSASMRMT